MAFVEVYEDKAKRLQVVPSALLNAQMGVHGGVSSCARQILTISVRNVLASLGISEPFRQAEVDHVHKMLLLPYSDKEIIWFHISVKEVP